MIKGRGNPQTSRDATSRSGVAALASSLLPGWGQLLTGRQRLGIALIAIDVVALAALGVMLIWFPSTLLEAWVTPAALMTILVGSVVAFLYRSLAMADSFFRPESRSLLDWVLGFVAVAVVVVPHFYLANLIVTQNDLIHTVFAGPEPIAAVAATTTSPSLTPEDTTASTTTTSEPSTTTTAEPRIWDGYERLNIMLLGSDSGVGRIGTRTDTIILVSIEPQSGDVAMFSIPRNLTEAPLPDGMGLWECNCFPDIITHLWANGEWYPDAFPGPQSPSVNALKAALGLIFDLEVHYYAKVDLAGFVAVFDAIGGVTIDVPRRLVDETYPHEDGGSEYIVFEPGIQHLDGHHALAYSRIRRHSGDFARMHRQRCVLGAVVDQTGPIDILAGYGHLAEATKSHVETDIPIDRLGDMVDLLFRVETDRLGSLRITRYNYGSSGHAGYQLYDLEQIKADAKALMEDPTILLESQDGQGFDATCDQSFD
ncbi:MAG: LCP family protein [Acidimicrobiia bacterium]